jgi:hypothetical protein
VQAGRIVRRKTSPRRTMIFFLEINAMILSPLFVEAWHAVEFRRTLLDFIIDVKLTRENPRLNGFNCFESRSPSPLTPPASPESASGGRWRAGLILSPPRDKLGICDKGEEILAELSA